MYVLFLLGLYLCMFLQIFIHEAGHLVFGLMTGYRFSSFRLGSFMLLKKDGKLHFKRLSLAGTGGQCLMIPPDWNDGRFPFVLYNLGGVLFNLLSGMLAFALLPLFPAYSVPETLLWLFALIGLAFALLNGVPLRMGLIDNDGANAVSMGKNTAALRAFYKQFKINESTARGIRLKDMPDEWFYSTAPDALENSMTAALRVCACNRLLDMGRFAQARAAIESCLQDGRAIGGLHRALLTCDLLCCLLLEGAPAQEIERLLTPQQKKIMKSMRRFPSVLRTQYVYALLLEKDAHKADAIRAQFEKCAVRYPYESDIQSERELMARAQAASASYK